MPDASPHCKRSVAELSGVSIQRTRRQRRRRKASDARKALVGIKVVSRPRRPQYAKALFALSCSKPSSGGLKHARDFKREARTG
jgi:hypothetical protein